MKHFLNLLAGASGTAANTTGQAAKSCLSVTWNIMKIIFVSTLFIVGIGIYLLIHFMKTIFVVTYPR